MADDGVKPGDSDRNETRAERYDRNWGELLQEVRVIQTGNQILYGFLLILPFQSGFGELDGLGRGVYLAVLGLATLSTISALAPTIAHRLLFRQKQKPRLVHSGGQFVKIAVFTLGLALAGAAVLVVDQVLSRPAAYATGAVLLLVMALVWVVFPVAVLRRGRPGGHG